MTHYAVLGCPPGATYDELHAAYRALAIEHHPDKNGDAEKFSAIALAWGVLKDEMQRAMYDRQLNFDGHNCDRCGGRGLIFRYKLKGEGPCEHCQGTGRL